MDIANGDDPNIKGTAQNGTAGLSVHPITEMPSQARSLANADWERETPI
jgi:hypothetical protein